MVIALGLITRGAAMCSCAVSEGVRRGVGDCTRGGIGVHAGGGALGEFDIGVPHRRVC